MADLLQRLIISLCKSRCSDVSWANVMATLKGTDATDDRVLIISGHLDSRVTDG
jgi:hypothetical protein